MYRQLKGSGDGLAIIGDNAGRDGGCRDAHSRRYAEFL
jgi:hypothetical protein